MTAELAVVVIGRNEGQRLLRCLASLAAYRDRTVYVDSGSVDGSATRAEAAGFDVVRLDASLPFTAARARNIGSHRALERFPSLSFIQFVDGDCEVEAGWIETATAHLIEYPEVAAVCGRRRESHREASVYNRIVDMEWDAPTGLVAACGGDVMMRVAAFRRVGGYDGSLIAGEDPEICARLRARGYGIVRLEVPMTQHDAALRHPSQWWRRTVRAGYAFAERALLGDRTALRRSVAIVFWAGALPVATVIAAVRWLPAVLFAISLYGFLWVRILGARSHRSSMRDAALYATACVLGKVPELEGVARFVWARMRSGSRGRLIEYKGPGKPQ